MITAAIEQSHWERFSDALVSNQETAWMILASMIKDSASKDLTVLIHEVIDVAEESYDIRTGDELILTEDAWYPAFQRAANEGYIPIFVHTHPGTRSQHSKKDEALDIELARVAKARIGEDAAYGSLIIGGSRDHPEFTARVKQAGAEWLDIDRIRIVGERLMIMSHDNPISEATFNRQVLAFGKDGQKVLENVRIGVIGAGGTGSAVIEQLIRLGVKNIVVVDPQKLTATNVTRVYGSSIAQVDQSKVDIAKDNGNGIGLKTNIVAVQDSVLNRSGINSLLHCDVVFGCTDDHASRLVATRLPQALLQLFVDCGVMIDSRNNVLFDIFARVTVVTPTSACLMCTGDVDPELAATQSLSDHERQTRIKEGYAPELNESDPSVITFTTLAASLAVNEMLSRLFGYADRQPANHLVARIGNREFSRSRHYTKGSHRCGDASKLGVGAKEPFLDYGWSS